MTSPRHPPGYSEEVYPNSPLIEVVFEVRFPGNLDVECQRHLFWRLIRDRYPNVLVPPAQPGAHVALQPYRFEDERGHRGLLISMNRIGVYSKKYPGFRDFRAEITRAMADFAQVFDIDRLTRVGWRYINLIPFAREEGLVPLDQFLTLGFKLPDAIPPRFQELELVFISRKEGGTITTRLGTAKNREGQEAFVLDFDYGKEDDLVFTKLSDYLEEAHDITRRLFEDLITDPYRQFLRGDVI